MKRSYSYDLSLLNISLLSVFLILLSGFQAQAKDKLSFINQNKDRLVLNVKATDSRQVVSTSAQDLLEQEARRQNLAQNPQQALTRVTGVEVKQTPSGVQVILKTPSGQAKLVPLILPDGNNLVVEILDATLAFSIRNGVTQTNPAPGIKEVRVSKIDATSIRVTIAGEKQAPSAEVVPSRQDLVLSVTPKATAPTQADEEIEIVVTGQREEDNYAVPNARVGTRTNAELRDVPQSIQVIPRQVIEDQGAVTLSDALRNVSGVAIGGDTSSPRETFAPKIRGFEPGNFSVDGTNRSLTQGGRVGLSNVEQIEVLKGPASVLYGSGEPGGAVNVTTKQPQRESAYELSGIIGNFDFYNPSLDFTGPLNQDKTILYRLNVAYENSGSFIDFNRQEVFEIYPVLSFQLSKNTKLTFDLSYNEGSARGIGGVTAEGTVLPSPFGEIPVSRTIKEPDFGGLDTEYISAGYRLEHQFSDRWSLNSRFLAAFAEDEGRPILRERQDDGRTFDRFVEIFKETSHTYTLQTDLIGKVKTGIVGHDLLLGVDLSRNNSTSEAFFPDGGRDVIDPIDIFNPVYGADIPPISDFNVQGSDSFSETNSIGVFGQDLLSIGKQVKILAGGRFDWSEKFSEDDLGGTSTYESPDIAFSPRLGIVYQPTEPVSLYSSWSRSTLPQFDTDREGNPFVPIQGDQFEVGVRTELLDDRLITSLAAYQITRQNDLQPDPVDPENFQIQLGEQRNRGIEFDLSGEPLPGLRLIATYAYTDSEITEDTRGLEGNQSTNVPAHSGSLWAVYEIQQGDLKGFGIGSGVFLVGERPGDLENTFDVTGYTRTDALVYYRRDNWKVQLNFDNLFDVRYFESSGGRDFVYPGAPFTVRGQLSVEF